MAISRPSSDRRSTRAIRAGTSGRFDDSEESYGKVTHRGAPERQSLLERASNPPRETSSVSETSISWRRGPGQRKRTGSLSCARRCSRRSVGITVSTRTARGNRDIIPSAGTIQSEIQAERPVLEVLAIADVACACGSAPRTLRCTMERATFWSRVGAVARGMMETAAERRTSRRFSISLPVRVQRKGSRSGELLAHTRDVSFRGLYFLAEAPFEKGTEIEFVLTLPKEVLLSGEVNIRCFGQVIRVEGHNGRCGVAARIDRYEFLPPVA